jgi:hypothetical protein
VQELPIPRRDRQRLVERRGVHVLLDDAPPFETYFTPPRVMLAKE